MKRVTAILIIFCCIGKVSAQTIQNFHNFNAVTILEDTISLSQYAGKKLLVVNTASYCGFTPQFADLQALDSTYSSYNFEVIGFPCNDFGGQDPHNDSTILGFCSGVYGVTFQMMSKISIIAPDTSEIYKWLQLQSLNGVANAPVTWNFNKYCIDENGNWIMHFPQYTLPFDTAITNWITGGSATGIGSLKNKASVKLITNPVKENIRLSIKNPSSGRMSILLYSAEGIFIDNISDKNNGSEKIVEYPVNKLANGMYILKILSENNEQNLKVCIVK